MSIALIVSRSAAAAVLAWVASIAVIEGGGTGCLSPYPPGPPDLRELSGAQEVPPNSFFSYGFGRYELSADETELRFIITAFGLSGPVTAAHFHNAQASVVGPVVLDLAPFLTEVETEVYEMVEREVALAGASSFADWSIDNVVEEIRAGRVYVNLHTDAYPDGEIRGQVLLTE